MERGGIMGQGGVEVEKRERLGCVEEKIEKLEDEVYREVMKEVVEVNGRGEKE